MPGPWPKVNPDANTRTLPTKSIFVSFGVYIIHYHHHIYHDIITHEEIYGCGCDHPRTSAILNALDTYASCGAVILVSECMVAICSIVVFNTGSDMVVTRGISRNTNPWKSYASPASPTINDGNEMDVIDGKRCKTRSEICANNGALIVFRYSTSYYWDRVMTNDETREIYWST